MPALPCPVRRAVCLRGAPNSRGTAILPALQLQRPPAVPCSPAPPSWHLPLLLCMASSPSCSPSAPDPPCSPICLLSPVPTPASATAEERGPGHICPLLAHPRARQYPELGPLLLSPDTCQWPLLLTFPGQKKPLDLSHTAWKRVFGNLPKATHNGQVLAESPTLPSNFPLIR